MQSFGNSSLAGDASDKIIGNGGSPLSNTDVEREEFAGNAVVPALSVEEAHDNYNSEERKNVEEQDHNEEYDDDDDISALEYARRHHLVYDYLKFPVLSRLEVLSHHSGLTRDSHLHQFVLTANIKEERVKLEQAGAKLLAWASTGDKSELVESMLLPMLGSVYVKNMRLELPLLKSDHQMDCSRFACRKDFETKLKDVKLPLEVVDDEKNEGLAFPSHLYIKGDEIMKALKKERLAVSKETILVLTEAIKMDWTEADEEDLWKGFHIYKKV